MEDLAQNAQDIVTLARSRNPQDRERLLASVIDLCAHNLDSSLTPEAQTVLEDIFMSLVAQAEWDIRQRLAQRLSTAPWAPSALISVLALDDIEIAPDGQAVLGRLAALLQRRTL